MAIDAPQGSQAWHDARLGKVTASRFADVLPASRTTSRWSKTAQSYMMDQLAERWTQSPQGPRENEAMRWGHTWEPEAVKVYAADQGLTCYEGGTPPPWDVNQVGFIDHPTEKYIGGSPDRLVGDDGGLEIKCPFNTRVHLEYYLGGGMPKEHVAQVQGLLWITGWEWWDFCSYDHRIPDYKLALFRVRVERDEPYIDKLSAKVIAFRDALLAMDETLTEGLNA